MSKISPKPTLPRPMAKEFDKRSDVTVVRKIKPKSHAITIIKRDTTQKSVLNQSQKTSSNFGNLHIGDC